MLECLITQKAGELEPVRLRMRLRRIMVVGEVTNFCSGFYAGTKIYRPTKPIIRRGHESGGPQKGTETRALVLRDAAGAKPLQCTKV